MYRAVQLSQKSTLNAYKDLFLFVINLIPALGHHSSPFCLMDLSFLDILQME